MIQNLLAYFFSFFLLTIFPSQMVLAQWVNTENFPSFGGGVPSLAINGTNLFAGTFNAGVFLTTDNGESWNEAGLVSNEIWSLAVSVPNLFAGTESGVFLSTNNGLDWTEASSGLAEGIVYSFTFSGSNIFAGTEDGVYLSTNNGTDWSEMSVGLPGGSIRALAVSGSNLFASAGFGVYLSTDNGAIWSAVSSGLPTNRTIYSFAIVGTTLFAGTSGAGVYVSTNNGTNWTAANSGLENDDVWALAVSGTSVFAGTEEDGVFLTTNSGSSWINTEYELGNAWALALTETEIYAAGGLSRVAKRPLSELITDVENTFEIPSEFILEQNYPNPFNPTTNIKFQIVNFGFISLRIYDNLGKEVKVLLNEEKPAGVYEVQFDASNLASGIYFYKLQSGNFMAIKKMMFLK